MKSKFTYLICVILPFFMYAQTPTMESSPGESTYSDTNSNESSIERVRSLRNKIERKKEKLEGLYIIEEETLATYGGGTRIIKTEVKKHIYRTGKILITDQENKLLSVDEKDYEKRLEILKEIDRVQGKLHFYITQRNTRPTEKLLKKLKDPEEIRPVFFNEESQ